ncbi:hypothetical protein EOD41_15435 [Mucilaginibacter limnophilus]|uniref:SPOR domain-containing protein n=1 Tax=Mucilaginibacter limnophilus TaxID=1932778 RepID=A0A3S2UMT5_9SPHI|nr:SPOR domain-containing protein [Mucilaginibacter limnophilus]RVT99831.1 hypothetical protein EOD41_15435 [Mucilaginibacter limnophilus]
MNLSLYLVELLALEGKVTVPGLGHFFNARASAWYNEDEGKFYPPHNTIKYEQDYDHDIRFAQFIAERKGISVTSASFFIDKYVDGLLQEVATNDAQISGLGWLRYDGIKITFKPDTVAENDPAFFGLPAFELHRTGAQPVTAQKIPDLSFSFSPTPTPPIAQPEPEPGSVEFTFPQQGQDYFQNEEYEEKRGFNVWIIIAIVFIVLGGAAIGLYLYKPSFFGFAEKNKPLVAVNPDTLRHNDSAIQSQRPVNDVVVNEDNSTTVIEGQTGKIAPDTAAASETTPAPTASVPETKTVTETLPVEDNRTRWELQAGFYNSEAKATQYLSLFTKKGLNAEVVPGRGKKYIITLGTFYTYNEARTLQKELLAAKKIKPKETIIKDYPPVKK